ncbi:probable polyol transporter 3 isoform X3 [Ziziphus jujuba]|uniref:Probable polyol transporter 3 isoform X3 n=1 Tax=Ziziphus jujuba TaxID=326968 RepID=A0ABM3ISP4_ZIZJJ|nr:probable polyol transporter 3 isoform X3 [Ziziphus jujuba]
MASMDKNISIESQTKFNKYACACAIVASMISIIFGYDTGVMSGAMIFIKEDLKINDVQVEVLAGILNLCALIGSLTAGRTSDYIGRRYTIVLSSVIFLVGAILMGYGPNYAVLMAGRCIAGIGVGFALMIAPVYSAEISSPTSRGTLTSLPELCISFGILLGYVSNFGFGKLTLKLGWRMMLGIAALPSIALALCILKMPESPRMKDDDGLPTTTANTKKESSDSSLIFGKGRYKFWALAAILLLAFWSMFTGTVTLRWSAGNLNRLSDDLDIPIHDDLDVLEMEERENVVKHMWDIYTNSRRIRLPRFWQEAFEAAYEDLTSDVPGVREAAISEIAKMSVRSIDLDPPPVQSTAALELRKTLRLADKGGVNSVMSGR